VPPVGPASGGSTSPSAAADRRVKPAEKLAVAARRCRAALAGSPRLLEAFGRLLEVSSDTPSFAKSRPGFTLAWPGAARLCHPARTTPS
jgi:hypothetical protein